jgi:two-component system chemotaxis sensor kinase CheA
MFVSEAMENIASLEASLLALEERGDDDSAIERAFRHAHSIKGMASSMGYAEIQDVAHAMEDVLAGARAGAPPPPERIEALLAALDAMRSLVRALDRPLAAPDTQATLTRLRRGPSPPATPRGAGPSPGAPSSTPASTARAAPDGSRVLEVRAGVSPRSQSPAVRAFIACKRLGALGTILRCDPPLEAIRAGEFGGNLYLELATVVAPGEAERVLSQIPDLESIQIVERDSDRGARATPATVSQERPTRWSAVGAPVSPRAPEPLVDRSPTATVRIRAELLDRFMDSLTDLLIAKAQLAETARRSGARALEDGVHELERAVRSMHDRVMEVRLLAVGQLTERLPRLVRDLAVRRGKRVRLEIAGADVEIDRAVVEALDAPLLHLVRNAVDHGIEAPDERMASGKAVDGLLRVVARRERGEVVIEVSDDGRGIDLSRLRSVAKERGLVDDAQLAVMSERETLALICVPGLTTAAEVTDVSGRGVGMDAVKIAVEGFGGRLEIASEIGVGTRFVLRLPVTVSVVSVLAVRESGHTYAFPTLKVESTALAGADRIVRDQSGPPVFLGDAQSRIPIHRLSRLLGFEGAAGTPPMPLVLVATETGRVAIAVDALLGQHEVVLRPLGKLLERVDGLAGVTIFGDGRPVFLLDGPRLCRDLA